MLSANRTAVICDFAETYHIYDIGALPARYVATLASGLDESTRIGKHILGTRADVQTILTAKLLDCFNLWLWANSKDGGKGAKRPESYADALVADNDQDEPQGYASGADFDRAWAEIHNKGN